MSGTYPVQASSLRRGGYVMLKGFPCKIIDMSTSKTGKHGHAKVHFTGLDIFTNKKYEDIQGSTHNMDVPNVVRTEYQLLDIDEDGYLSLMEESGDLKEDISLEGCLGDLSEQVREAFEAGKELLVTVLGACDREQVMSFKETK